MASDQHQHQHDNHKKSDADKQKRDQNQHQNAEHDADNHLYQRNHVLWYKMGPRAPDSRLIQNILYCKAEDEYHDTMMTLSD